MSAYLEPRVEKPEFFRLAPTITGRGKRQPYIIGFDTEADTRTGHPMLIQFSLPGTTPDQTFVLRVPAGKRDRCLQHLIQLVLDYCTRKDTEYLIFGWYLPYEFTQLFGHLPDYIREADDATFILNAISQSTGLATEFEVHLMNDKRTLLTITNLSTKRMVRVLDGMSFYKTGLDKAAKMLNLGEKRYADSFDVSKVTRADLSNPEFIEYAKHDAYITRRVGEHIVSMFEEWDVPTCISAPHFASRVFRHRFLRNEIQLPDPELEQAGLWSYHGGKNGFYLPGPTLVTPAYNYDITSAYPEAMRQLPDPEQSEWPHRRKYRPGMHAIVHATLRYRRCKYRGMMAYDGTWPLTGYIEDAYITSYELDAMMERGECDIITFEAWEMDGPVGDGPLVRYVDTFFDLKARTEGPERETAKLFLNSLYGKFFQKVALGVVGWADLESGEWIETDPDQEFDWRAGGLYHPPIASLITGFVRARIHRLEHRYGSLMTSTDGIFGTESPDSIDLGKHLGGLTVERGDLRIWRERLYDFQPPDGKPKFALHGFRGDIDDLRTIPLTPGRHEYVAQQGVTLKLSTRRIDGVRYEPGRFVTRRFTIDI